MDLRETGYELDSSGLGQGLVAGSWKHGNEPSGCIKHGSFLDYLMYRTLCGSAIMPHQEFRRRVAQETLISCAWLHSHTHKKTEAGITEHSLYIKHYSGYC
jgi:hypothetical protein